MINDCIICDVLVDVKNKKGGETYDNECTLKYLCPKCRKLWNDHTEDKVNDKLVFEGKQDFNKYVKYLRRLK